MFSVIDYSSISDDSSDDPANEIIIQPPGKLNNHTTVVPPNNPGKVGAKNWYLIALSIGMLIISGSGGFGAVSLLHSYGIISLSNSLPWLASAIGTIGNTSHFWSLWVISGTGLFIGYSGLVACGYKLRHKLAEVDPCFGYIPQEEKYLPQEEKHISQEEKCQSPLDSLEDLKIDPTQFPRVPEAVLPQEGLEYDLNTLIQWYKEEFPKEKPKIFKKMISEIRNKTAWTADKESFSAQMEIYLKNLIHLINKDPLRKRKVLIELAGAAKKCAPTWLEVAIKQFDSFHESSSAERQLLKWIQEVKEELILNYIKNIYDNAHWNVLNHWRYHMGTELGLGNAAVAEIDPYFQRNINAPMCNPLWDSKEKMRKIFNQIFTEKALLDAMVFKVQADEWDGKYDTLFHEALLDVVCKMGYSKDEAIEIVSSNFFDEDTCKINRKGIMLLLKSINYLK
jgi:hypothetical protein